MARIQIDGKQYDYKPYYNPLTTARLRILLRDDISFQSVFTNNMTDGFIQTMQEVVDPTIRNEDNTIWEVGGVSGSGKSRFVITLAKRLTPKTFTYKNVVFYDQQVLDLAPKLPRDSFIIRDEAVKVWGVGSSRVHSDLTVMSETCRKAGVNLAFLCPSEQGISVAKLVLQTVDIDYVNKITRVGIKDPSVNQFLGGIYVKVLPDDDNDWIQYNKSKDEFIEDVKDGKKGFGKTDFRQIAIDVTKKIDINVFRSKKQREAFLKMELSNLTLSEIKLIHELVEIILEEGEDAIKKVE